MSKIHFITYGNATFTSALNRITSEANKCGWFDSVTPFKYEDLTYEFKKKYKSILSNSKGGGFCIWKYDIIINKLNQINDSDILIYLDSGCTINEKAEERYQEYIEMLKNSDEAIISFICKNAYEKHFTSKELFNFFEIDSESDIFKNSRQFVATVLIMKKCEKLFNILNDFKRVLNEKPNYFYQKSNNQYSEFKEIRHDQSVFSLIRKIHGSIEIEDESYIKPFGGKESLKYPFWATRKN